MSVNYTPDQKEYKEYKGFGTFKMFVLQNFPFIAEDFDALTYYQMLCKIVEYLKDVIENNKAIQDNQTGVLDAYNQLQSFVNNYFDNLDVQNEVNSKLDIMATDGTLANIINQDIYNDIHNRMNQLESDLNSNIENLNEEKDDIKEYVFKTPYIPASRNIKQTTPKFVNYNPINKVLTVIQRNHSGYLKYVFDTKNGDTSSTSVGLAWDLIRLKKVLFCPQAYVFKNDYDSFVGDLFTLKAPVIKDGFFEKDMFVNSVIPLSSNDVFYKNKPSIGIYGLRSADGTSPSEVRYKLDFKTSGKANIVFYCTESSATDVDILINERVITKLKLSAFEKNQLNCYYTYEFDIPQYAHEDSNKECIVTIRNNDNGNTMYFCCMNYMELKDYDGRDYDSFKATSSEKYYINAEGASDYAIYDSDLHKFMGSYHGGETALQQQIIIPKHANYFNNANSYLSDLPDTEISFITPVFEILQRTNLNNKGTMLSVFDFNSDGQIFMNFNFEGNINTSKFFTALTCNSTDFDIVKYPDNKLLTEGENVLIPNNGMLTFTSNGTSRLRMDILYSKFYDEHINSAKKNGYVLVNSHYNKFYYGAVMESESPVNIKNLNFQKILDFYTY